METKIRRYDLDWLRVIVFGLLIFYHVGMFFVPWGWHIKNNVIYEWLRWPMIFLNQWRLPILFVISGMGTYYALGNRNLGRFVGERYLRLVIPLLVGMLLIVPPQVYFERLADGDFTGSYFEFYTTVAFTGIYPEGNFSWHHLWFLPYLFLFSLILAPLFIWFRKPGNRFVLRIKKVIAKPFGLYMFIVPIYLIEVFIEPFFPVNHALVGDWYAIAYYLVLFSSGFLLISSGDTFWTSLENSKGKALGIGAFSFTALTLIWLFFEDSLVIHLTEAFFKMTNLWSWILVLFGYAAKYLNRPSTTIAYANRAVYPFYILHQTITVALAYYLLDVSWGLLPKATLLVLGTFGISWLIYHFVILPLFFLHPLFGLKKKKAH
ncbi:MAG: acyltransferase family protein [Bacteroidota bacterium]